MLLRRLRSPACSGLLALAGLASASNAHAQSTGFALNRFDPSERGSEWFALDTLDLRGSVRPAIGIVGDYAYRPLVLTDSSGKVKDAIVNDQFVAHLGASLVLASRVRVALDIPIQLFADGTGATVGTTTYASPSSAVSFGDVRLGADLRLVGEYGDMFTAAVGANVFLPTGSQGSYASDGGIRLAPHLLAAGDIGPFVYAAKLGILYRADDQEYSGSPVGSELQYAASVGLRVADRRLVVGPELFGASVIAGGTSSGFTTRSTPVDGLLGAHYTFASSFRVGAGVGLGLTEGFGSPEARVVGNLEWAPGIAVVAKDRDHDGVLDAEDACPDVAGVKTDDAKTNGCPLNDRDHDGVLDDEDACPDVAGIKTDDPKTNGCPADRDHDGVPDAVDACPDVPGVKTDDPKTNGCPADRDHDGVPDSADACPDVPGLKTDDPATNGCPDPDRDKDGIPNDKDACPDEPGPPNADPAKNGCPKAIVRGKKITIIDQIRFKTASTEILPGPDSEGILQAVLEILKAHPEIKHVKIEGHTDNRGSVPYNNKLSAGRASSVQAWLVGHGIDASRLSSIGYGPSRPIAENTTEKGRTVNRRVEFQIEDGEATP